MSHVPASSWSFSPSLIVWVHNLVTFSLMFHMYCHILQLHVLEHFQLHLLGWGWRWEKFKVDFYLLKLWSSIHKVMQTWAYFSISEIGSLTCAIEVQFSLTVFSIHSAQNGTDTSSVQSVFGEESSQRPRIVLRQTRILEKIDFECKYRYLGTSARWSACFSFQFIVIVPEPWLSSAAPSEMFISKLPWGSMPV